ncbi:MAG: ATP-binding protein [Gemmatimonadota bacterium]|nr:ATP-binding protein [Gemmatimonadota bacterium]MDQ8147047.1 ATP-binding protein [Gemmatimonadota bacterium]MDQ8148625.1 ATP-binding protein [Gemmatimonadota bacterium]MDQ8156696.1 ATP-binding protein [Gemmatimonadota bacterium]MDQ8176317.1 ATP-binding protein [Gemmatimonadota bacterium]
MTAPVALELRVPSDVGRIEEIVTAVVQRCRQHAFTGRQLALNVPVALTEALSNAMLRGNGEDRAKEVRVRAVVDASRLVVEVEDEGTGFDLEGCTGDPTTPEALAREDGRGLFLMRALMDEVRCERGAGTIVRLTLHRR